MLDSSPSICGAAAHLFVEWEFFTGYLCSALTIHPISYIVDRILPFPGIHMAYKSADQLINESSISTPLTNDANIST